MSVGGCVRVSVQMSAKKGRRSPAGKEDVRARKGSVCVTRERLMGLARTKARCEPTKLCRGSRIANSKDALAQIDGRDSTRGTRLPVPEMFSRRAAHGKESRRGVSLGLGARRCPSTLLSARYPSKRLPRVRRLVPFFFLLRFRFLTQSRVCVSRLLLLRRAVV